DLVPARVAPVSRAPRFSPDYTGQTFEIGLPWGGRVDTGLKMPAWLDETLAGAGCGLVHTGRSVANLVGLVPDSVMSQEKQEDQPLMSTTGGKVGNFVGETVATLPAGMGAGAALGRVAPALADSLIAQGAAQGAAQGTATADPG